MILKCGDKVNGWTWISGVKEISEIKSSDPYDVRIGSSTKYSCYRIIFLDESESVYALGVKQAYLCNEQSGSTIDVLITS